MYLASGVIHFQLFYLLLDISNWCILPYYLNVLYSLWTHWFVALTVLPFTALCYSSHYFPTAANEQEVIHIDRKQLIFALKNEVDIIVSSFFGDSVIYNSVWWPFIFKNCLYSLFVQNQMQMPLTLILRCRGHRYRSRQRSNRSWMNREYAGTALRQANFCGRKLSFLSSGSCCSHASLWTNTHTHNKEQTLWELGQSRSKEQVQVKLGTKFGWI